eukprot:TRINITY_DN56599_c0_g1_i1.p1 TRINITY_DN56599_c0_g1~~TRINITY_DN56599_c0_g1_i1.p1  ORF type:complete len:488 (+),score=93.63 TRINITY_DN56599_c0_g1_i1:101-1465(+)
MAVAARHVPRSAPRAVINGKRFVFAKPPAAAGLAAQTPVLLPSVAARRSYAGSAIGPSLPSAHAEIVDAVGYPDDSASQALLSRCLEAALERGVDVTAPYTPWMPVDVMQTLLVDVHAMAGCSWMTAICLAVVSIRVVTLPVTIASIRGSREKALIQPRFQELAEKQKQLAGGEGDQEKVQKAAKDMQDFLQKHGRFFMLKGTWNLLCFQMPLYITAFASMRGFASYPHLFPSFAMEAPFWLDSLALADPYALFPLLTGAIMITNTELFGSIDTEIAQATPVAAESSSTPVGGVSTVQKYQKWIMRGSALAFVPMTWNFPAGVFVFMSTNLLVATLQNRVLRHPVLERLLEIPPTPENSKAAAAAVAAGATKTALLPLGRSMPKIRREIDDVYYAQMAVAPLALPAPAGEASPSRVATAQSNPSLKNVEGLQVNPRYAVQRAPRQRLGDMRPAY